MMTPIIFFPFSHVSRDQLAALQAFFPSFTFFPAAGDLSQHRQLQELTDKGLAVPILSSREDIASVDRSFDQYMAWVRVNRGNEGNLRFLLKDIPYFTSDSDLTAIKSQIRGAGAVRPRESDKNGLLRDLLFLKMAQHCDRENELIDIGLKNVDKAGRRMLSTRLGEEDSMDTIPSGGNIPDPGAVMTRERMEAWSRCMIYHHGFRPDGPCPLFVTTSESVVDYLETISSDTINALDINPIKVHENDCENSINGCPMFAVTNRLFPETGAALKLFRLICRMNV